MLDVQYCCLTWQQFSGTVSSRVLARVTEITYKQGTLHLAPVLVVQEYSLCLSTVRALKFDSPRACCY